MRKPTAGFTLLLACLMIFALAPAAAAQLLPTDPIGGIGDPLGGGTDGSGSSGGGSGSGGSGGGVGGVVDGIEDTLDGDDGSSEPDGETEGDPKLIDRIANEVNDVVKDPQTTVDETTKDPSGSVGGTIGGTTDSANKDIKDVSKGLAGKDRKDRKSTDGVTTGSGRLAAAEAYHDDVFAMSLAARRADAKNRTPSTLTSSAAATTDAGSNGVIQQIGRVAAEAASQAAFPLLLTLLVGAFLIGQNRIDSRDPKLALAPIDSAQDLLSFT